MTLPLKVRVSCDQGCDLRGRPVHVVASDEIVASSELADHDGTGCETELLVRLPTHVGDHTWRVLFPEYETELCVHEESAYPLCFKTIPHACSMAVWDVPSAVPRAGELQVNVGVRCSAGCQLTGRVVEVYDELGKNVGEGVLGDTPLDGTGALYWTAVGLLAPTHEGVHARTSFFAATGMELPHESATAAFSFRTDSPREHRATVRVVEERTRTPAGGVEVRCGPYRASTDERGVAQLALPTGTFELSIRKDGLQAQPFTVVITEDLSVDVEAAAVPTRAELNARVFKDYPWG